ncbi:MAG: hypothetical protein ACREXY_13100, partial [Gammaproteobacteria bacterium]
VVVTSHYCPECCTNWAPYMTSSGACPECGTGTKRVQADVDDDAMRRYHAAFHARAARERSAHRHAQFEEYYAQRELVRARRELDALPTAQPTYRPRSRRVA